MATPAPEAGSEHQLVWAPGEVMTRIEQEVRPQPSLPRRIALAASGAFVLSWPPTFVVFALATFVAPSVTDEAGVGRVALWALQFAGLTAVAAVVGAVLRRSAEPELDPSPGRIALRIAGHALVTVACAGLVLALAGLSVGQYATLTATLVVVLHLLPMAVARLLFRLRRRGSASPSA
ncbi:hypothetical protein ACIBQ2_14605 [Micromonospora sediminimaris]|uniref:Uncharacterized protein n=1 Tax=Micromonospora sediminimaris TaxID=547162 RepID=A0A9W5UVY7_9ACTN|nr:hypothetical protein [Micromonospora sediminimaris]GIJ35546.1 hypothetical protein Vse01_46940 [Micromonospora sediminimaris]SFC56024.1 hypothetical protein SAMN05216284_105244 [Micromonospora sediminimaris]